MPKKIVVQFCVPFIRNITNNRLIITLDPFRNKTIHNFVVELCDELNKESPRSPKGHIMEFHVKD